MSNEDYLTSVATLADFAFGVAVTEDVDIRRDLPTIVNRLVKLASSDGVCNIKKVHSILSDIGINTSVLKKYDARKMFIEAAFIHLIKIKNVHQGVIYNDIDTLIADYPGFISLDPEELNRLLHYRNYMVLIVKYISPKQNRDYLLNLLTRITEGAAVRHVPGSGATPATKNRMDIYWREGGVQKRVRPLREGAQAVRRRLLPSPDPWADATPSPLSLKRKRSHEDFSDDFLDESFQQRSEVEIIHSNELDLTPVPVPSEPDSEKCFDLEWILELDFM